MQNGIGIILFLICSITTEIFSQTYVQPNDPIPGTYLQNESILDIVEGPMGFVWIATNRNLYRFDGLNMSPFLEGNFNDIEIYPEEKIMLFSNRSTIFLYDYEADHLRTFENYSNLLAAIYHQKSIWFGTGNLMKLDLASQKIDTFLVNEQEFKNFTINSILADRTNKNLLWLGTPNGVVKFNTSTHSIKTYQFELEDNFLTRRVNRVACIYQHKDNTLFIGTWHGGVIQFIPSSETYSHFFIQKYWETPSDFRDHVYDIFSDTDHNIWFSSVTGALKLDGESKKPLIHLGPQSMVTVADIGPRMIDREKRHWIGYYWGLKILNPSASTVIKAQSPHIDISKSWNIPKAHFEDLISDNVYLCYNFSDGLHVWNQPDNSWELIPLDPVMNQSGLNGVNMIHRKDTIWILGQSGIYFYTGKDKYVRNPAWYTGSSTIFRNFIMDDLGRFWINSDDGIYLLDLTNKEVIPAREHPSLSQFSFLDKKANEIYFDNRDQFWMAYQDTIYTLNTSRSEVSKIPLLKQDSSKLGKVNCFLEMDSSMWIGTTEALVKCPLKPPFTLQTIANSYVRSLIYDQQGDLWFTTQQNLHRLFMADEEEESYSVFDGLPEPLRFGYEYLGILDDGTILVMTRKAVALLDPSFIRKQTEPKPTPYILSLQAAGQKLSFDTTLMELDEIRLEPRQRSLDINFSAIAFDQPQSVNYRYMLAGVDEEWRYTQTGAHEVSYLNLNAGQYTFLLNARYANNTWEEPLKLDVICRQKFFENEVVWFVLASIFIGGIVWYFRWRIKKEKEKQETLRHLNKLERKALTAQMNPHFIFNAMNSIQHLISNNEHELAQTYMNKFAYLLRGVFEASKKGNISLQSDLSILDNYIALEALRYDDTFDYIIEVDNEIQTENYLVPALIAQPIVENAIHHGLANKKSNGHLCIHVSEDENHLIYSIQDDGIGRAASQKHKSQFNIKSSSGIQLTESRLRAGIQGNLLNQLNIEDLFENGTPAGTKVILSVPKTTMDSQS